MAAEPCAGPSFMCSALISHRRGFTRRFICGTTGNLAECRRHRRGSGARQRRFSVLVQRPRDCLPRAPGLCACGYRIVRRRAADGALGPGRLRRDVYARYRIGFRDVVFITSNYGLGETVVQGAVNPDEFYVFKPALANGHMPIIRRALGSKLIKMQFSGASAGGVETIEVAPQARAQYSIADEEAIALARLAVKIERHYDRPMDIEWAKDGRDGQLYILLARPETVKSQRAGRVEQRFRLKTSAPVLATGRAIGQKIGGGPARIVRNAAQMARVMPGDVLVAEMTDPNWEPVMKRAAAIVTNRGGGTCHAAIIARELGVPAVGGCGNATEALNDGALVTVSCAEGDEGRIYSGALETEVSEVRHDNLPDLPVKIMMNIGNPQLAFEFCQLPNAGVGLARLEFIINHAIGVHPKAVLEYPNLKPD